ncbi:C-type lectin domain family 10 member A-like isoform X1 [Salarias fasciatus]|uniref:C-type lectin domain family 10 member A-like isoform X1 n=1 Tax=Salarias fasciatus TaxID=181472 RepID=UPI001176C053|nr:C-type lectin domain family 10 member A-like isoform X1 [Salarias fasciatus]
MEMHEEEVSYASVVFRTNNAAAAAAVKNEEQCVYDEVKVPNRTKTPEPDGHEKNQRHKFQTLACCFGNLCLVLLLVVVGIIVYVSSLREQNDRMRANQASLQAVNQNLTKQQNSLGSDNESLRRDNSNLTVLNDNLTQASAVLERNISQLTAEKEGLMGKLEQLRTENQDLEAEKKNLTEKLQEVEKVSNEVNISRAQWSLDQYCYGRGRSCNPCQDGWRHHQSQCYAVIDHKEVEKHRTWEEAREDCRGKISDLVVINNNEEKRKVSNLSWNSGTGSGYWIGLRVLNGTWKWVDGTELTDRSWNEDPVEGRCVISVQWQRWESVSCDQTMRWICEKKSLTV